MAKKLGLTKDELRAFAPCSLDDRLALFGDRERLTVRQALKAGASVSDILWVAARLKLRAQIVEFAQRAAAEVAHLKNHRDTVSRSTVVAANYASTAAIFARSANASALTTDAAAYANDAAADAAYAADYATSAAAAYADFAATTDAARRKARQEMIAKQKQMLIEIFGRMIERNK